MFRVYMDANATTPLLPEVMEAMRPYWMEQFGNASSIHMHGQAAHRAVDQARETLAEFFNCREAEVVFNSGGTEGDNTAIFGLLRPGDQAKPMRGASWWRSSAAGLETRGMLRAWRVRTPGF